MTGDLRARVHVVEELALRLDALEAAQRDVLADLLHELLRVASTFPRRSKGSASAATSAGFFVATSLATGLGERDEVGVLRDEVGFRVHFHERADVAASMHVPMAPVSRDAARPPSMPSRRS
jgi:hypothetical protein